MFFILLEILPKRNKVNESAGEDMNLSARENCINHNQMQYDFWKCVFTNSMLEFGHLNVMSMRGSLCLQFF